MSTGETEATTAVLQSLPATLQTLPVTLQSLPAGQESTLPLLALMAALAYLIGSVSFAVWVSRWMGLPDPHTYGSGNPGATNVLRTGSRKAAFFTLLGDAGKGVAAVALATFTQGIHQQGSAGLAVVALAVLLGHLYPVFHRFRGGKGVATAAGVLVALDTLLGCATIATWIVTALVFRYSSLAALAAAFLAPAYALVFVVSPGTVLSVALMSTLLVLRHTTNIRKLLRGEESRIGGRSKPAEST
jgi:glycerol-3-phosphate acyltransferase PlsY